MSKLAIASAVLIVYLVHRSHQSELTNDDDVTQEPELCRDRRGPLPVTIFKVLSCSMCYNYLFHTGSELTPDLRQPWKLVPVPGSHVYSSDLSVIADVTNQTAHNIVCSSLSHTDCGRWVGCCNSAITCCHRQLSTPHSQNTSGGQYCPSTWDGYGCFDRAPAGSRAHLQCPSYVEHASTSARAYKDCSENGTWWVDPITRSEWTNYSTCVPKQDFHTIVYIALACNIASIVLLVPACGIFIFIRQLRSQKRIKLHLCLFASFILTAVVTILWDFIVYVDRLENTKANTIMHKNTGGCKFLYVLSRYAGTANFFWMFCEGFYLHRLIVHAFAVPKSLIPYYIFGWGLSWLPTIVYSIIRAAMKDYDHSCWVYNAGGFEWIMYIPNLLCIAINLVFLGNILRILCSKLQSRHNEPSNYRKALKATFVLIPLFGLQQFLVIYRPPHGGPAAFAYEIFQTVVKNTQGAAVALIFCFFNGEVHSYIKSRIGRHWKGGSRRGYLRKGSTSSATQFTTVSTNRANREPHEPGDRENIALSTSSTTNEFSEKSVTPTNGHVTFAL